MARGVRAVPGAARSDVQVGNFCVQRIALGGELFETRAPVGRVQQRALTVARKTRELCFDRRVEPDHETALAQDTPVRVAQNGAAAGREHYSASRRKLRERRRFALAKARFAFEIENEADRGARVHFDLVVEIVERHREQLGDVPADRGLAGSHRADEDQVGRGIHAGIIAYAWPMLRFLLLFLIYLAVLFTLELLQPVDRFVILPFTAAIAKISVAIVGLFDAHAVAYGKILESTSNHFAISIERGCNGVEAVIILVSAMLAFPAPWKHRLIGIGLGFIAIQALNLVRIISLFYLGQWNRVWFDWFHLYLWQALIVLDALIAFLIWLRYLPRHEEQTIAVA